MCVKKKNDEGGVKILRIEIINELTTFPSLVVGTFFSVNKMLI